MILLALLILISIVLSSYDITRQNCTGCEDGKLERMYFDKAFDSHVLECDKCHRLYCNYHI